MILKKLFVFCIVAVTALPKKDEKKLKSFQKLAGISDEELDKLLTEHQDGGKSERIYYIFCSLST